MTTPRRSWGPFAVAAAGALVVAALVLRPVSPTPTTPDDAAPRSPAESETEPVTPGTSSDEYPAAAPKDPPPEWVPREVLPSGDPGAPEELHGLAVDPSGRPVPNARLRLFLTDPVPWEDRLPGTPLIRLDLDGLARAPDLEATAAPDGRFAFTVPARRTWRIDASAGDVAGGTFGVGAGSTAGGERIVLHPAAPTTVVVRDAASGAAIVGATVHAWHVTIEGPPTWSARTDAEGRATLPRTGHESWLVLAPGHQPQSPPADATEVRLARAAEVSGSVCDETGRPLPAAAIFAEETVAGYAELALVTRSDASGRFVLPGGGGEWARRTFVASALGFQAARFTTDTRRLTIRRHGSVEGEIRDAEGRPSEDFDIAGAVRLGGGRFRIFGVDAGVWRIVARGRGGASGASAEAVVLVRPGETVRGVQLRPVTPPGPVAGTSSARVRVVVPPGLAPSDVDVALWRGTDLIAVRAPDADGHVVFDGVPVPPGTSCLANVAEWRTDAACAELGPVEVTTSSEAPAAVPALQIVPARTVTLRIVWDGEGESPSFSGLYVWGEGARVSTKTSPPDALDGLTLFESKLFVPAAAPWFCVRVRGDERTIHDASHWMEEVEDGVLTVPVGSLARVRCRVTPASILESGTVSLDLDHGAGTSRLMPIEVRPESARLGAVGREFETLGATVARGMARLRISAGRHVLLEREVEISGDAMYLGLFHAPCDETEVRVLDGEGWPLAYAVVHPSPEFCAPCLTDSRGRIVFATPPGTPLTVWTSYGARVSAAATRPDTRERASLELRLVEGASLVLLRGGAPVWDGISVVATPAEGGPPRDLSRRSWIDTPYGFVPLLPGRHRLLIRQGERTWERDVEAVAGVLVEVDVGR